MLEIIRLLLGVVFAVAGITKLADREGSAGAMRAFGVPARLTGPLALLLPFVELGIAVGLVPAASARAAAGAATALLAAFTVAMGIALARGRRPDCHCFGRLYSSPAGWGTLARNAALAAVAAAVVSQPAANPSLLELGAAGVIVLVSAQAILCFALLRRYGRALQRIEEIEARPSAQALKLGAEAPLFEEMPARGRQALLIFTASGCGPCEALLPKVAAWQRDLAEMLAIAVVNDRPEVAERFGVEATPSAVLVGVDGTIAHELVAGGSAIEELVRSLRNEEAPAREPAANGRPRIPTAAALAGGLAVTATAHASTDRTSDLDPELKAIDDALKAGLTQLAAASARSSKAVRAQAALLRGKKERAKRAEAARVLAAERQEALALRRTINALPESTSAAHNVKTMLSRGLTLLAQSLQTQQRSLGAAANDRLKLNSRAQKLFLDFLASALAARKALDDAS